MSLDIFNEGRVVGYSAYETYIKQFLSENPTGTPATEREWLSSMLASGASLMLRIDADTDDSLHVRDIALPANSKLRAANFIMANYTNVEVASADRDYPTKVASYSNNLVPNTNARHPTSDYTRLQGTVAPVWVANKYYEYNSSTTRYEPLTEKPALWESTFTDYYEYTTPASSIPTASTLSINLDSEAIKNYFKIKDGVVLQDGTWFDNPALTRPPRMGFTPDMSKTPIVRLLIDGRITQPFYILLTGFTDATVLEGTTGIQDSQLTHAPENGDYLGPATFPWAGKIIFSVNCQTVPYLSDLLFPYTNTIKHNDGSSDVSTGVEYVAQDDSANALKVLDLPNTTFADNPSSTMTPDNFNDGDIGFLNWAQLFLALAADSKIDLLADIIRQVAAHISLQKENTTQSGAQERIFTFEGASGSSRGYTIKVGKNYIDFNGIRLYVSTSSPSSSTDNPIPNGSIGIGWT